MGKVTLKKVKCQNCGHIGVPIKKMFSLICKKCRIVLNSTGRYEIDDMMTGETHESYTKF